MGSTERALEEFKAGSRKYWEFDQAVIALSGVMFFVEPNAHASGWRGTNLDIYAWKT